MKIKQKITAIGMSGGVDSTMATYLLKKQGYKVIGLTMKIYNPKFKFPNNAKDACFGLKETKDLKEIKKIAQKLKIKHYVINLKKEYEKLVLNYFKKEYLAGHTPNPCIICNQKIKFDLLLELAKKSGIKFDYFATGHYVRLTFNKKVNHFVLKKGKDKIKDQSYFLYRLNQKQLQKTLFPLGELSKTEVKNLANKLGFKKLAKKSESQDFIGYPNHSFIFSKNEFKKGNIIDLNGKILGQHKGIIFYTIGQRKGVSSGGTRIPMYVVKIDAAKNQIVIGPKKLLYHQKLIAIYPNWISINPPKKEITALAKIRYGAQPATCLIKPLNNQLEIKFNKPQLAITPGQSIVFYKKDVLLGGAVISQILS